MEVDIELLRKAIADMEYLAVGWDDDHSCRNAKQIADDGNMPESYYELIKLLEGK
jgi:hypothetical protein